MQKIEAEAQVQGKTRPQQELDKDGQDNMDRRQETVRQGMHGALQSPGANMHVLALGLHAWYTHHYEEER